MLMWPSPAGALAAAAAAAARTSRLVDPPVDKENTGSTGRRVGSGIVPIGSGSVIPPASGQPEYCVGMPQQVVNPQWPAAVRLCPSEQVRAAKPPVFRVSPLDRAPVRAVGVHDGTARPPPPWPRTSRMLPLWRTLPGGRTYSIRQKNLSIPLEINAV